MRRIPWQLPAVLAFTAVVFSPALRGEFLTWDDVALVSGNPVVHEVSPASVSRAFTSYDPELYIPLTLASFQMEHAVAGDQPLLYHIDNLLLHLVSAALVFWILLTLGAGRTRAAIATAFWAVHPVQVEVVAWISARKDVLAGAFALGSFLAYMKDRRGVSWILFLCSLLSKVSAVTLPLAMLLYEWQNGWHWRIALRRAVPWLALSVVFGLIALGGKGSVVEDVSLSGTLSLFFQGILSVCMRILWLEDLSILYPADPVFGIRAIVGLIILFAAASGSAWLLRRERDRAAGFGLAWFLILLLPAALATTKGGHVTLLSDKYLYLPLSGLIVAVAGFFDAARAHGGALSKNQTQEQPSVAAGVVVILILGALSFHQAFVWRSSESLYIASLAQHPAESKLLFNLGEVYHRRGDRDAALAQ